MKTAIAERDAPKLGAMSSGANRRPLPKQRRPFPEGHPTRVTAAKVIYGRRTALSTTSDPTFDEMLATAIAEGWQPQGGIAFDAGGSRFGVLVVKWGAR